MGLLKNLGDFLFGKDADVFDERGRVVHKFPEEKWQQWDARLKANPKYNFQNHIGKERAESPDNTPPKPTGK